MRSLLASCALAVCLFSAAANASPLQGTDAPPVCLNGGPYIAECTGTVTAVTVDGCASFDPDGTDLAFDWFEECAFGFFEDPTACTTNFVIDNAGVCTRTCVFALRVTSGGQTVACQSTVTVQDTTAPVLTCPADVVEVWTTGPPIQTDPLLTGFATASDCDPAPVIGYTDTFDPGVEPGEPETIVTRTWTALDFCGNQSSCIQTITLLSPSGSPNSYIDFLGGSCPNTVDASGDGVLTVTLFGSTALPISQLDTKSFMLLRRDNVGGTIKRSIQKLGDIGRPVLGAACHCDSTQLDGLVDLKLTFSYPEIVTQMSLASEAPQTSMEVILAGKYKTGNRWVVVSDCITVE